MKNLFIFLLMSVFTLGIGAQTRNLTLNISVTADTGEDLTGQPIQLQQTEYALSYGTLTLNAQGQCTVKVYPGEHNVTVERHGYLTVSKDFTVVEDGQTVSLTLAEQTRTPYSLSSQVEHDAYQGRDSIRFTWNTEAPAFFDDFEDYTPFATQFGEWTGIDADQKAAAALQGSYPNRCVMQYAQIIAPLAVEPTWWYDYPILRPYDGKQYVGFTRTQSGEANDDWLISPVITVGTENFLVFMGKAADQFPERFQVYVTTHLDEPRQGDFTQIDQSSYETADYTGWHQYSYDLAQYAGQQIRFAIRYISEYNLTGSFMLMIDDVYVGQMQGSLSRTLQKARAQRAISRSEANPNEVFHVYMDQQLVGTTEDYSYIIGSPQPGEHTLGVKAVYNTTETSLVTLPVTVAGSEAYAHVTFAATTNSVLSAKGLVLQLVSLTTSETYQLTLDSDGQAEMAALPRGAYLINIEEGAFEAYQQSVSIQGDTLCAIGLSDRILAPYNMTIDQQTESDGTVTARVRWNQELSFTDSFEDYDDFATGQFGQWRSIDLDQMLVYPISLDGSIITFPGSATSASDAKAIAPMVFNPWTTRPAMMPRDAAVAAPTGQKTIIFFSPQRYQADKWLISPQLTIRNGYVLRITAKAYEQMYPESMEFCLSTEGPEPASFVTVSRVASVTAGEWTIYETDLSAYADQRVYIGIHYTSTDAFFTQIDDFTVGPGEDADATIDYGNVVRYDLYLDGQKVGESTVATYTFSGLTDGQHTIGVKAIYQNGESSLTEQTVNVAAGISTILVKSQEASGTLYNMAGQRIRTQRPGIYIMKQGNKYQKICR